MFSPKRKRLIDTQKDTQYSDAWIALALMLLLAGIAANSSFLNAAALMIFAVSALSWLWNRFSLHGLAYTRYFSETRAFCGETIELRLEVHNKKILPLTWLNVVDNFPAELPIADKELKTNASTNLAEMRTFWMVGPFRRVSRRYEIRCTERGFHRFGPAKLSTGDGFGFFSRQATAPEEQRLIVYPRIYSVAELRLPARTPFGEARANGILFEDPLRTVGIRAWQSGDNLRRVHWKATARHRELLSRIYEPSEEQQVLIFLNVATLERHWYGHIPELQERTISVAGSLASLATEERTPVGMIINGALPGSDQALRLLPGRSPGQLMRILEMLAAVTPLATKTIEQLLLDEAPRTPWGATLVIVTAIAHKSLLAVLMDLAAAGRKVVLFTLTEEPPRDLLQSISIYHLPHIVDDLKNRLIVPEKVVPEAVVVEAEVAAGKIAPEPPPVEREIVEREIIETEVIDGGIKE